MSGGHLATGAGRATPTMGLAGVVAVVLATLMALVAPIPAAPAAAHTTETLTATVQSLFAGLCLPGRPGCW